MKKKLVGIASIVLFFDADAFAHDVGVARSQFIENDDGTIHGQVSVAAQDSFLLLSTLPFAIDVRSDETSCKPGTLNFTPDGDGVLFSIDFACKRATRKIEVIDNSGLGENVTSIATDEGIHEEILHPAHRTISVDLHRAQTAHKSAWWNVVMIGGAIAALGLIAISIQSILRPIAAKPRK